MGDFIGIGPWLFQPVTWPPTLLNFSFVTWAWSTGPHTVRYKVVCKPPGTVKVSICCWKNV